MAGHNDIFTASAVPSSYPVYLLDRYYVLLRIKFIYYNLESSKFLFKIGVFYTSIAYSIPQYNKKLSVYSV